MVMVMVMVLRAMVAAKVTAGDGSNNSLHNWVLLYRPSSTRATSLHT